MAPSPRLPLAVAVLAAGLACGPTAAQPRGAAVAQTPASPPASPPAAAGSFLFCTWNVENLFDDRNDRRNAVDRFYDEGFADDEKLRALKFDRLAAALLRMNDGKGPDVIACMEVESTRAAEMLTGTLNAKIKDPAQKYRSFGMKNLDAGRHIAPCVITRLQQSQISTKLHGGNLRILETHVYANGHDLTVFATHWTSQLKQDNGGNGEEGRYKYARTIRAALAPVFKRNPAADVIVCGDFNCTPDSKEVLDGLGGRGDRAKVKVEEDPLLLDLLGNKAAKDFGTLWYNNAPLIYDHIVVSPGMLDTVGWTVEADTVKTETAGLIRVGATKRQPWRFGDPGANTKPEDRGYADHFPVTVRLTVAAANPPPVIPEKKK